MKQISVIIPVYNVEKYLKRCLDSVVNQSYKNLEIILIDDGSTDNSSKILKQYSQKDVRIIILNQKNLGAGAARNKGIKVATGKYIVFMDPDDFYPDEDDDLVHASVEYELPGHETNQYYRLRGLHTVYMGNSSESLDSETGGMLITDH